MRAIGEYASDFEMDDTASVDAHLYSQNLTTSVCMFSRKVEQQNTMILKIRLPPPANGEGGDMIHLMIIAVHFNLLAATCE